MGLFKRKKEVELDATTNSLGAIIDGQILPIEETPDAVFSQRMMGDGVVFVPSGNKLYACMDAEVSMIFPTKHAIGLRSQDGIEMLIHVGLDTVELQGAPFTVHVEVNQKVKAGTLLMDIDFDAIKAAGKGTHIPVIVTNGDEVTDRNFEYKYSDNAKANEIYCSITKK